MHDSFDTKQRLEATPLSFGLDDGRVVGVCPNEDDDQYSVNIKKAVISAIQMSARSTSVKSHVQEVDILGNCDTEYEPIGRRYATLTIQKSKQLNRCSDRQYASLGLFPRAYGINQLLRSHVPLMNATYQCIQTIDKDIIIGAKCQETQQLFWSSQQPIIASQLSLRFEKVVVGVTARRITQFSQQHQLLMATNPRSNQPVDESQLTSLLRKLCQTVSEDSIKPEATQLFTELVAAMKSVKDANVIQRVDQSVKNGELCSSPKLRDLYLDASALASTQPSIASLVRSYQNRELNPLRASYIFSLLAFTSNPSVGAVKPALPLLQSRDTPRQVVLGISGLIHNLCEQRAQCDRIPEVKQAIEALIERITNSQNPIDRIAYIKAIDNINPVENEKAKQKLQEIASNSRNKAGVRVAAINALHSMIDYNSRQQLLAIFKDQSEQNEIRIAAYKTIVMSGSDSQTLEQIKQQINSESNGDIRHYVRSHQKNLRDSSDPHKRDVLPSNAPHFSEPSYDWRKSRNYEVSYLSEAINLGATLETDVIFPKNSQIPRSLTFNVSIPAFGKELQVVEIHLRQKGFDQKVREIVQNSRNDYKQMIGQFIDLVTDSKSRDSAFVQLLVSIDGKSVLVVETSDLELNSRQLLQQFKQNLEERMQLERAFASMFLDTKIQFPTINGIPLKLDLNGTFIAAIKADVKVDTRNLKRTSPSASMELQLMPSFAFELSGGINLHARNNKPGIKVVQRFSSSPVIDTRAELRDGRLVNVKFNLPKERQTLLRAETQTYYRESNGAIRRVRANAIQEKSVCTQSLHKPLGISICSDFQYSRKQPYYTPFAGEIYVKKSDQSMRGYELNVEIPQNSNQETQIFRISANTPNSQIDRELSAELQVIRPQDGKQEIKLNLRSPQKQIVAYAAARNDLRERSVQLEVTVDGDKKVSFDAGIDLDSRGKKVEYKPRLRLVIAGQQPISLSGSVSLSRGRKNQLQIDLEGNQRQVLKGSFVKEGDVNSFRVSSDVTLKVPQLELRVAGIVDKAVKHSMTDLTVDYKWKSERKESVKVSAKVQNLSQSQLTKMSAFGEFTSTQFPKYNMHLAYNLLRKPAEHMENELTVAWKQQLKDKIHILQVSKVSSPQTNQKKVENTLLIEATPFDINYELRINGEANRNFETGPNYNVDLVGKDRTGRKQRDVRGQFQYRHGSRSPLQLEMDASLEYAGREMAYHDELKEMSPNEYKGKTSVQWQKGEVATLDYNYRIKSDSSRTHHEIDAELRTPHSRYPTRHTAMLRMSRDSLDLKSRVNYDGQQLYNFDSSLSSIGPSKFNVEYNGINGKFDVNPYSNPQLAGIEVTSDKYHHKSSVQLIPKTSFALKSDTKKNARNILAIESHFARNTPSKLVITSDPFEARAEADPFSRERKYANFEFRKPNGEWSHVTNYVREPQQITLKSKTELRGKSMYDIDSRLARNDRSFIAFQSPITQISVDATVHRPQKSANFELKSRELQHKTSAAWDSNEAKLTSNTIKSRQQLADIVYNYNRGVHDLALDSRDWSSNINADTSRPYGKVQVRSKRYNYEHETEFNAEPEKVTIQSRTDRNNQNLANINAILSRSSQSSLRVETPRLTSQLEANIYGNKKSGKFQWNCPRYDHVTTLQYQPKTELRVESRTQRDSRDNYNLEAQVSRIRPSFIKTQFPTFDASINYEKPRTKFDFAGKTIPYNHVTEFDSNNSGYTLNSRTDHVSGKNYMSFEGLLGKNSASRAELKYGPHYETKLRVDPYSVQKSFNVDARARDYNHQTDIKFDRDGFLVKSRTERNGQNLAKIDSYLTPKQSQTSHVTIATKYGNGNLQFEPQKRVKFEFAATPYSHKSQFDFDKPEYYKFDSQTANSGRNLLNVRSQLSRDLASHLNIESPQLSGIMAFDPKERSAKFELQTDKVEHKSNVKVSPNKMNLNSNTIYKRQLLAKLNGQLSYNDNNQFEVELPQFAAKSNFDYNQKLANIDFRSKLPKGRHVLAAVAMDSAVNGFHVDVSWDVDRNPDQRLVLNANINREGGSALYSSPKVIVSLNGEIVKNQFKLLSKMATDRDALLKGPHSIDFDFIPRDGQPINVKANHEISNGELRCKWQLSREHQLQYSAEVNGKVTSDRYGPNIQITAQTTSPQNSDLEYKLTFTHRPSANQWFSELRANKGTKQYLARSDIQKKDNSIKGLVTIESPQIDAQTVNFNANWDKSHDFKLDVFNKNGKQLELNSFVKNNQILVQLNSDIKSIPSVKLNSKLDKNSIDATFDLDNDRKLDLKAKYSGSLRSELDSHVRVNTAWTQPFEVNARAKRESQQISGEVNSKYGAKELFAAKLDANKLSSGQWSGSGHVTENGAELAALSLESAVQSNQEKYVMKARAKNIPPVRITWSYSDVNNEKRPSLQICTNDNEKCVTIDGAYKHNNNEKKLEFSLTKVGTQFRVNFHQLRKYGESRDRLEVVVNGHMAGYDVSITPNAASAQLTLPSRAMEAKANWNRSPNGIKATVELNPDSREANNEKAIRATLTHNSASSRQNSEITTKLEIQSKKWARNKVFEFHATSSQLKPFDTKLIFDFNSNPNKAIYIESNLHKNNDNNNTLTVNVYSRDRKSVDVTAISHFAKIQNKYSVGLLWKNLNRNQRQRQGFYLIKGDLEQKTVKIEVKDPNNDFSAFGNYNNKDNRFNADLTIESEGSNKNVHLTFDECLEITLSKEGVQSHKWHACADLSNNRLLQLTAESFEDTEKITDLSLVLDTRHQKTLKLHAHWDPSKLGEYLYSLAQNSESRDQGFNEINEEIIHKSRVIGRQVADDALIPVAEIFIDEINELIEELAENFKPFRLIVERLYSRAPSQQQLREFYEKVKDATEDVIDAVTPDWLIEQIQYSVKNLARSIRKKCKNNSQKCYQILYSLENYGLKEALNVVARDLQQALKSTHRVIINTSGKLVKYLPEINIRFPSIGNSEFAQNVAQKVRSILAFIGQQMEQIIESNDDLKQLSIRSKQLVQELYKEYDQINWSRVQKAINDVMEVLLSKDAWKSSSRVLLWDPQNGELQLELKSPVETRTLKAIFHKESRAHQVWNKLKTWINNYVQKTKKSMF